MANQMDVQIALAGVCQAACLVRVLARTGKCDQDAFEATIGSIVETDPENTADVYGSIKGLQVGLETLQNQLSHKSKNKDSEITRYIASILGLERKLTKNPQQMAELGMRIEHIKRQQQHSSLYETQMVANLASIYKDLISPLGTKIQVAGNPNVLKQQGVQDRVRALLLAGIRSAVLWRQLGGKRRHIIFQRNKILEASNDMLQSINHSH